MSKPTMTAEEFKALLESSGIKENVWGEMGGGNPRHPAFILRMAQNADKLKRMLEGHVQQKQAEIAQLEEQLHRIKYGGGR